MPFPLNSKNMRPNGCSIKNTTRHEGSTGLYAAYIVDTFDTVFTVDTVDMVYTFDMLYTVDMVYTFHML